MPPFTKPFTQCFHVPCFEGVWQAVACVKPCTCVDVHTQEGGQQCEGRGYRQGQGQRGSVLSATA